MKFLSSRTHLKRVRAKAIVWHDARYLEIIVVWNMDGMPLYFAVGLVYKSGHTAMLVRRCTIETARYVVLALSAQYDLPVHDWTRPAPTGSLASVPFPLTRRERSEYHSEWGVGWLLCDDYFREGVSYDVFYDRMNELANLAFNGWIENGHSAEVAQWEAHYMIREAHERWQVLSLANPAQLAEAQ